LSRILYLSYDGIYDPLGQSQVIPYLNGLSEMGHQITLISFEKKKLSGKTFNHYLRSPLDNAFIKWIPMVYHKYPPVFSTIYDLSRLKRKVKALLKSERFDIIHCRSYITALIGLWAKRRYNIKFLFDTRGFWIEERVEGNLWNLNNSIYNYIFKYFKKKEKEFIGESDHIVSLTTNAIPYIESILHENTNQPGNYIVDPSSTAITNPSVRISVVPTCVDKKLFDPFNIDMNKQYKCRAELGLSEDEFLLLYSGSIGTWYMLDEMLDFFNHLLIKLPGAKFLILTNNMDEIFTRIKEKKLPLYLNKHENQDFTSLLYRNSANNILITSVSHTEMPLYISLSSATICFLRPAFSKKGSSATKIGESLVMGKPVITNSGWGDIDELILPGINGWLVKNFNKTEFEKIIDDIIRKDTTPEKIHSMTLKNLSLDIGVKTYHEIYQKLTN